MTPPPSPTSHFQRRFEWLSASLAVAAGLAVAYVLWGASGHPLHASVVRDIAILAVLAVIADEMSVRVSEKVTLNAASLPLLLASMFGGPPTVLGVAAVAGLWGGWREDSPWLVVFNAANHIIAVVLAAWAFESVQASMGGSANGITLEFILAGAAAATVLEGANLGLLSLGAFARYGRPLGSFWREEIGPFLRSFAVLLLLGLAVAALYAAAGIIAVVLLFIPLFASQYMFKLLVREREHLRRQTELSDQYLEMNIGLAAAMVVLLDSKDEYTAQHSAAVAMYCRDMADALGLDEDAAEALHLAGLLHDLGKVGVPDAVLRKDGPLDEAEWDLIRQHPAKGAEVLSHLAAYREVADIVRYHHERLDGSGYPYGLTGDRIPELSKILAVADTYHAMTSDRPYRSARGSFEALRELRAMAGTALESRYVETLARVLRDKDVSYRAGTATDFVREYERGRINLRLRGQALADVNGLSAAQQRPAAG